MTTKILKSALFSASATTMALMLFGSVAFADDAKDAKTPPPKWETIASADLALTRGNSRSFLGTVTINTHRKWESDEVLFGGAAGYGTSTTKNSSGQEVTAETQDYLRGSGQYNHLFTDRLYAGFRLEGLHDNIADINYRFTVSPLAGYYFIKETNTLFSGEVGPSLITQELAHVRKTYAAFRLGERFEHTFDGGAKIWETLEFLPQIDDFSNWILNAEVGVSAPIVKSLDVRLVAQDTYNNHPATDHLKNDLKVLAGIGYRF
jgi:putative salt-induced outer membrane protein YdiY